MANKYASVLQSGTNNFLTSAEMLNAHATDHFSAGVVGTITNTSGVSPATGSFAVNAQGSPNMTVAVTAGQAYVSATPTGGVVQTVRVRMDAAENVTISANATGGTRYDFVYIKVDPDKLNNPAVTGLDVVTLITQRSTTTPTDSNGAPSNSLLLAIVTVSNGASSIANANITDSRVRTGVSNVYDWTALPTGSVVQIQGATNTLNGTTTTVLPADNTIPQNTEGVEVTTQSITPKSASNILIIDVWQLGYVSTASATTIALFQDSTANALAAAEQYMPNSNGLVSLTCRYIMTAGTTSAITFKYRVGQSTAGTFTYGTRYSTAHTGGITITEVKA